MSPITRVRSATSGSRCFSPRRPCPRSHVRSTARTSRRRSRSAASQARERRRGSDSARSSSVRGTLVTGMASRTARSSGSSLAVSCTARPLRLRVPALGTVTWIRPPPTGTRSQSAPASPWLRSVPSRQVRTAAIQRPRTVSRSWPTAYTPAFTRCSRPLSRHRRMAPRPVPRSMSCWRATTPCCRGFAPCGRADSPEVAGLYSGGAGAAAAATGGGGAEPSESSIDQSLIFCVRPRTSNSPTYTRSSASTRRNSRVESAM